MKKRHIFNKIFNIKSNFSVKLYLISCRYSFYQVMNVVFFKKQKHKNKIR